MSKWEMSYRAMTVLLNSLLVAFWVFLLYYMYVNYF